MTIIDAAKEILKNSKESRSRLRRNAWPLGAGLTFAPTPEGPRSIWERDGAKIQLSDVIEDDWEVWSMSEYCTCEQPQRPQIVGDRLICGSCKKLIAIKLHCVKCDKYFWATPPTSEITRCPHCHRLAQINKG